MSRCGLSVPVPVAFAKLVHGMHGTSTPMQLRKRWRSPTHQLSSRHPQLARFPGVTVAMITQEMSVLTTW